MCIRGKYDTSGVFQFDYQRFDNKDGLDASYRVNVRQNHAQPLEIEISRLNETRTYQYNQIWLAMFAMPVKDRQCLTDVLARLSPRLDLELRFNEVLRMLSRIALNQSGGDYDAVRSFIKQLNSPTFAERQVADRQLRMLGRPLIGFLAGLICFYATQAVKGVFGIDDSLDVFPVHGVGGMLGIIMLSFVGVQGGFLGSSAGGDFGSMNQFVIQLKGIAVIGLWTAVASWIILKVVGLITDLRVSDEDEDKGLDISEHEERSYDLT